jgi:hypothetical protein
MPNPKSGKKSAHGPQHDHPKDHKPHGHVPHQPLCYDPDYRNPPDHGHTPPANPSYPDPRIYGRYATKNPPRYIPHPIEHACFRPRNDDCKPPKTCDGHDGDLCVRKDHRMLTTDEQNRFLNAFTQINALGALGPLVDIHSNAIHQMHGNPRFLPWHRIYLYLGAERQEPVASAVRSRGRAGLRRRGFRQEGLCPVYAPRCSTSSCTTSL